MTVKTRGHTLQHIDTFTDAHTLTRHSRSVYKRLCSAICSRDMDIV